MNYFYSACNKFVLGFLLAGLLLTSCGVKAPPMIPYSPIPQTINDLKVFSRKGSILLQWSVPKKDTGGKKLSNLGGFHIWRQFIPPHKKDYSPCQATFKHIAFIDYRLPQKARIIHGKVTYWDDQTKKEGEYTYKIISYTTAGVGSNDSNKDIINWSIPLPPPLNFKATPGDRSVHLAWEFRAKPDRNGIENRPDGFNIYRRYSNQDYGIIPLNKEPIQRNHFRDVSVVNGKTYYYVARSLKITGDKAIESEDSVETNLTPEDRTPPASPSATMAFQSPEGIVIVWEPNLESDLQGYYVYRRLETEVTPGRISPLLMNTTFLDKTFSPGLTYYYSVTAVDQSPRQNESDFSNELKAATQTQIRN